MFSRRRLIDTAFTDSDNAYITSRMDSEGHNQWRFCRLPSPSITRCPGFSPVAKRGELRRAGLRNAQMVGALGTVFRMLLISEGCKVDDRPPSLLNDFYSTPTSGKLHGSRPLSWGGTSLVEAAKLGARCIGVNIDPVACFVTQMELTPVPPKEIDACFREIERAVAPKIKALYRSRIVGEDVEVMYNFWVDHIACPDCGVSGDGHPTYQLAYDTAAGIQTVVCPHCGELATRRLSAASFTCSSCRMRTELGAPPVSGGRYTCFQCGVTRPLHELYRRGAVAPRMFAFEYLCDDGRRGFAPVAPRDLSLYEARASFSHHAATVCPFLPVRFRKRAAPTADRSCTGTHAIGRCSTTANSTA